MADFTVEVHQQEPLAVHTHNFEHQAYTVDPAQQKHALPRALTDAWPPAAPRNKDFLLLILQVDDGDTMSLILRRSNVECTCAHKL